MGLRQELQCLKTTQTQTQTFFQTTEVFQATRYTVCAGCQSAVSCLGVGSYVEHEKVMGRMLKTFCRRAGPGTDLFVILWVGAVAITVQQRVLPPNLRVAAVAGTDPTQELLQFGLERSCLLTMAVR